MKIRHSSPTITILELDVHREFHKSLNRLLITSIVFPALFANKALWAQDSRDSGIASSLKPAQVSLEEIVAGWKRLSERFSNFTLSVEATNRFNDPNESKSVSNFVVSRLGDKASLELIRRGSAKETTDRIVKTDKGYFQVGRRLDEEWSIVQIENSEGKLSGFMSAHEYYSKTPFQIPQFDLCNAFQRQLKLTSISEFLENNKRIVRISFEYSDATRKGLTGNLDCDPEHDYWIVGFNSHMLTRGIVDEEVVAKPQTVSGTCNSVEIDGNRMPDGVTIKYFDGVTDRQHAIAVLEFSNQACNKLTDGQFTLSHYGFPEPATSRRR